jgi:transcriptional regulator GlxA family with amidase domain
VPDEVSARKAELSQRDVASMVSSVSVCLFASATPGDADARRSVLYTEEVNVLTGAGTAAGIDLCLHRVRLDLGVEVVTCSRGGS